MVATQAGHGDPTLGYFATAGNEALPNLMAMTGR